MSRYEVGYLVGSLSSTSINRRLAMALVQLAPPGLEMTEIATKKFREFVAGRHMVPPRQHEMPTLSVSRQTGKSS
jgi:NAD(P)H-dependent FMN reductase